MMSPTAISSEMQSQKKKAIPPSSPHSFVVCTCTCVYLCRSMKLHTVYGEFSTIGWKYWLALCQAPIIFYLSPLQAYSFLVCKLPTNTPISYGKETTPQRKHQRCNLILAKKRLQKCDSGPNLLVISACPRDHALKEIRTTCFGGGGYFNFKPIVFCTNDDTNGKSQAIRISLTGLESQPCHLLTVWPQEVTKPLQTPICSWCKMGIIVF